MRVRWLTVAVLVTGILSQASATEFPGWESLRVVRQDGMPRLLRSADLDSDGRQELIVVNSRSSRLDVYAWLPKASRPGPESARKDQPNHLPMAPEIKHTEVQLEHIPKDVIVEDLDADGKPELVVLAAPPNQVEVYHRDASGGWSRSYQLDLLDGEVSSQGRPLLLRRQGDVRHLLVSLNNGIQQLPLRPGGRAEWLSPRESRGRNHWWLADLDGDGNEDLVEQTRTPGQSIRWYRGLAGGGLMPAAVLFDRAVNDAQMLRNVKSTDLVLLDGSVRTLLRRYAVETQEVSPFGLRCPLAMSEGAKAVWCGMRQGTNRALVVADRDRPRLLSYVLSEAGWEQEQAFPAVSGTKALASPAAEPGTLLIWAEDAAELLESRWQSQRLTYPEAMVRSKEAKPAKETELKKILALASVGSTTWWVQKVDKHLDLYRWHLGDSEAKRLRFENVGSKADEVLWIGGDKLLVKDSHARGLKLAEYHDGKTVVVSPSHLKKASLGEYKLLAVGDAFRLGRLVEGVLQWIGDDLHSHEQVMLPQGQELADYVTVDGASGWALQKNAPFIHRIKIATSGLSQVVASIRVSEGTALVDDPELGMVLLGPDRVTHLREGRAQKLKLVETLDERIGRPGGVRKTKCHRLGVVDLDGNGHDDLLLYDDLAHRITALADRDGALRPMISWLVFDDKTYPYGEDFEDLVHEPRAALALDMDGDHRQDLALLCHNRLIIYFAREIE